MASNPAGHLGFNWGKFASKKPRKGKGKKGKKGGKASGKKSNAWRAYVGR
jgi:hypothetical protein